MDYCIKARIWYSNKPVNMQDKVVCLSTECVYVYIHTQVDRQLTELVTANEFLLWYINIYEMVHEE